MIDIQFLSIKIQPQMVDPSVRLWGIPTEFVAGWMSLFPPPEANV